MSATPSAEQIHLLLAFLEEHQDLARGQLRDVSGRARTQYLWQDLTNILNASCGAVKTVKQWKRGNITAQGKLLLQEPLIVSDVSSGSDKGKELHVFLFEQCVIFSEAIGKKTQFTSPTYHYRAHVQVQEWLGNPLPPTDWGFQKDKGGHLRSVTNRSKPAPDRLLEMVSFNCTQGCETKNCSCRRHKMVCSNICGHCAGHGCSSNTLREEDKDNDDHPDGDLKPIPCTETDGTQLG